MTAPATRPASPFDVLRARVVVVQVLLVLGVEALLFNLASPARAKVSQGAALLASLMLYATILAVLAVRGRRARVDWRVVLGPPLTTELLPLLGVVVPVGLLTVGAALAVYIPLSYVAPGFVERLIHNAGSMFEAQTIAQWWLLVLSAVVAAPIVEELFFRGFLLHRWARRWGTLTGVVASSALFAVLHGEWIGHFVFGVAMSALYLRTRRLWVPIAAHALNNAVVALFTLADVLRHAPPETTSLAELRGEWPMGLAALVSGAALMWWYLRRWWPDGHWRAVLRASTPYEAYAASAAVTGSPDSTSAS
jgi:membrane protease YdiL (CAAX protease family)